MTPRGTRLLEGTVKFGDLDGWKIVGFRRAGGRPGTSERTLRFQSTLISVISREKRSTFFSLNQLHLIFKFMAADNINHMGSFIATGASNGKTPQIQKRI